MLPRLALPRVTSAVRRFKVAALLSSPTEVLLKRNYRGDSGEGVKGLSEYERTLVDRARPRDEEIRSRHLELTVPESYASLSTDVVDDVRRRRLIYRAKQRGWLEVDILLGAWAAKNVPQLSKDELDEFEVLVNEETIDIYNILTLRTDIEPGSSLDTKTVRRVMEWCKSCPLGKQSESSDGLKETYAHVKKDANLT
uniref:Succinate dehydrogenase assembly factor 2, mitochondrial n=1 Tax=Corethron hystrix TaxID=216773 RepID=A0A6U5EYQ2_9STRA|mmetsp:Transcript_20765/g.47129  ORF Transcript_20765/g.47129 Transcript_20765/m.47129 type:complete len:197 (+) Transcript_20765:177-767(+)|eukprot:CAMPEP_0113310954 /NCGR_PEP_ID=MMETSP0010_2-20120614/8393_1 /TAXON_ID=216773 ORGANISM="Corethron hystrix, Strain 308" /NCGR_SAMPLE_ID=MMETSP0010_2 /ASSEMBLY_ACC=CAM_ASM_000155 /LENGTH=196 /DNA_ID=CAMNT_0000166513 /DNA_START=74 /DNA_END=664 /DNA_ORIENTATION=- /assembly_acc=CAM_ASM_000155